ncbi:DUF1559 family PulG-like putative transporter [Lacunimicrobium album]
MVNSDDKEQQDERNHSSAFFWGIWIVVGLIAIALILPAIQQERNGGPRNYLKNDLKQMGIAIHNYHDTYQSLPLSTRSSEGAAMHGWQTSILPFVEQLELYESIDLSQPWDSQVNRQAFQTVVPGYLRRSGDHNLPRKTVFQDVDPNTGYALTNFSANKNVIDFASAMTFLQITDGLSNTLLMGEIRDNSPPWGQPGNGRDLTLGINKSPQGFGGYRNDGANFMLADGGVRFVSEKIDPKVLEALATPTGGETVREEF